QTCIELDEMKLFAQATRAYPERLVMIDLDRKPGLARELREMGALHGVFVRAGKDMARQAGVLTNPSVKRVQFFVEDFGDEGTCDAICSVIGDATSWMDVGFDSTSALPDRILHAVAECPAPIDEVFLDVPDLRGPGGLEGAAAWKGLCLLLQKESLRGLSLGDGREVAIKAAICLAALAPLHDLEISAEEDAGVDLAVAMLGTGYQPGVHIILHHSDPMDATEEIIALSRQGLGCVNGIDFDRTPLGAAFEVEIANGKLACEMSRRMARDALAVKFGPGTLSANLSSFAASLPPLPHSQARGGSHSGDSNALLDVFGRQSHFFGGPAEAAQLAVINTRAAAVSKMVGKASLDRFSAKLREDGQDPRRVDRVFTRVIRGGAIFEVDENNFSDLCKTLKAGSADGEVFLILDKLWPTMAAPLANALSQRTNLEKLTIQLPADATGTQLQALMKELENLQVAQISLDRLRLVRNHPAGSAQAASLADIKAFIAAHEGAAGALVALLHATPMFFTTAQRDELVQWAKAACPSAAKALGRLKTIG
ncbi:MAG: hypothetical protein ABW051_11845, partial [Burkholderiaceae bacterium]